MKKGKKQKLTRINYEAFVNGIGIPEHDKRSNGGRVPDNTPYGKWLRRCDPIAFEVGFREWAREQ